MNTVLLSVPSYTNTDHLIILADGKTWDWATGLLSASELAYAQRSAAQQSSYILLPQADRLIFIEFLPTRANANTEKEAVRRAAAKRVQALREAKINAITILNKAATNYTYEYTEGLTLSNYQFLRHFGTSKREKTSLQTIQVVASSLSAAQLNELQHIATAVCASRDWVNEPLSHFNAVQMSEAFQQLLKDTTVSVNVLHKADIEALGMGGLLGVNKGSEVPPTFSIMEYKPANAKNSRPIVLVGKGLVYDSGGYSLKPTPDSMDHMKCDMGGAAVVAGTIYAAAQNQLPLHIIALVPATDNLVNEKAFVPGDVITISDGSTVEVLNTDAEGRLVLADALHFAKQYNPELVIDFATLTGAAARAIGQVGCVMMGTASDEVKTKILASGYATHERAVEFPLWDEYGDMIKSDIADVKNTAGALAGASTAGKFLEYFTNGEYPWLHFDIAATAFFQKEDGYWVKGGTGWGIRSLYDFLRQY